MKIAIALFCCFCVIAGAAGRWQSLERIRELKDGGSVDLTHDEAIFLTLAKNLRKGWSHYEVRNWHEQQARAGLQPPEYLNKPLFKHPPLLALLLGWAQPPGTAGLRAAFLLMLGFGAGVAAAVYSLARCFLPPAWSLVAAAASWVDPVLWAGSVKIWADLPLTLCCVAGLAAAWHGRKRPALFILSGLLFGLGFLTKYPAILFWAAANAWIWKTEPRLRRSGLFWAGVILPWLMLGPWIALNLQVYGTAIFDWAEARHALRILARDAWIVLAAGLAVWFALWMRRGLKNEGLQQPVGGETCLLLLFSLTVFGLFFFHSWFSTGAEPRFSLARNFFAAEGFGFYLGRMLSLDPLLWPGLIAAAFVRLPPAANAFRWCALLYFFAFSVWGNYQTRYIMPAVPLFCVLGAWLFSRIAESLKHGNVWLERVWVSGWLVFAACRLGWIHQKLTIPNQFTYF